MAERRGAERLAPHFTLGEFAQRGGVLPPPASVAALRRLCVEVLEPLRVHFGPCHVTSGYRSAAYNRSVGGASDSRHVYDKHPSGPAADVRFERGTPEKWAAVAISLRVGGVGLYKTHIHVDQRRGLVRW